MESLLRVGEKLSHRQQSIWFGSIAFLSARQRVREMWKVIHLCYPRHRTPSALKTVLLTISLHSSPMKLMERRLSSVPTLWPFRDTRMAVRHKLILIIFETNYFSISANIIVEALSLATSGPLEGRFLLFRPRHPNRDYLKKCSSVLGYSYILIKNLELLICDKLSPEPLINPKGTYEALLKDKRCTLCKGSAVVV